MSSRFFATVLPTVPTQAPSSTGEPNSNPFRAANAKPQWAELIRLAGDRAAILFQELRRHIARIDGLREELDYQGTEWGWAPRYRVGENTLFTARLLPGRLEAAFEFDSVLREKLLNSKRVSARVKQMIRDAAAGHGHTTLRAPLPNRAAVRSFAQLVLIKSKFAVPPII